MSESNFRRYLDVEYFVADKGCPIPIHEGTIRHLMEQGRWTTEDGTWNKEAIALMDQYVEASADAFAEAGAKGVDISYENEEWVEILRSHQEGLPPFKTNIR